MSVAQAQKMVELEVDGRLWRLSILEPLELNVITDENSLPSDKRLGAVLAKYYEVGSFKLVAFTVSALIQTITIGTTISRALCVSFSCVQMLLDQLHQLELALIILTAHVF
jgi:hypothetical protein